MIDKSQVAAVLDEIGTLLELKGENPFKSRAYHNASRIIETVENLDTLVRDKQLTTIKGIGAGLAEKIEELWTKGKIAYLDELQSALPAGLLEIIRIQGVGPKRAKILYDKLKIKDIPGLEKACKDGKVASLEGFGEKSQENILKGLAFLSKHAEKHRYDDAAEAAALMLKEIQSLSGVKRLSVCGSLRRHKEIIGDVDILVSVKSSDARRSTSDLRRRTAAILERIAKLPAVERVLGQGETKASVLLQTGIQVDVRVLNDEQYPYALHYFTGSKEHNIAMRQRAIDRGWKLSEYGLFDKNEKLISCKEEPDIFKELGLAPIPPEMREDRGEIEAASSGKLPKLVEPEDIRGVFHVHSTWSDGRAPLEEMIAESQRLGWEYVGISDHSRSAAYAHGLDIERVKKQATEIEALRKKFKIRIFWGTECDILKDGSLDYPDSVLSGYDFVIASVHSLFNLSEDDMTRRIIRAVENKYVTILGHMTGRLLLERDGYAVRHSDVLRAAANSGVAVELNASPKRLDIDWRELSKVRELGVQVSINPDAHSVKGLSVVPFGVGIARKGWLTKSDILNTMSLSKMTAWLEARKARSA